VAHRFRSRSKRKAVPSDSVSKGKVAMESDGRERVDELVQLRSIDLVTDPASTVSLFEAVADLHPRAQRTIPETALAVVEGILRRQRGAAPVPIEAVQLAVVYAVARIRDVGHLVDPESPPPRLALCGRSVPPEVVLHPESPARPLSCPMCHARRIERQSWTAPR
jgi:hypothetical protein